MRLIRSDYQARIRRFFLGKQSREMLVFLFFLCVSFGFWLLQTLNETFEVEITVPLQMEHVPERVVITTELPPAITVMVRDRGTSLIRYFRDKGIHPIAIDFDKYDNGAENARVQLSLADVMRSVQSQLDGTTHVLSIRPDTLEFYYNRGVAHRLPVGVCGPITTSPQNYLEAVRARPDTVTVYAPTSVLDTMRCAYTQPASMVGLTSTTTKALSFRGMKGVKYEPANVELTAQVGFYAEKTVDVAIKGVNFPADKELRTFPAKVKVTFRVESKRYNAITSDNFVLAVTYEELMQSESSKYVPHLRSLPEGVSGVRISPQEVDYLIERHDVDDVEP